MPNEPMAPATLEGATAITERRGWPLRAVMRREVYQYRRVNRTMQKVPLHAVGQVLIGDTAFPAQPIFPGIAADSALYAVLWWIISITPGAVKRWQRRRGGRCIGCGYDLAGLAVEHGERTCPECGEINGARRPAPAGS